jgi:ribosomal subunit interface protein
LVKYSISAGGGIGRRAVLRGLWVKTHVGSNPTPRKMKIIYFLKNLRLSQAGISFVKRQTAKIRRLLKKEKEALVEVELAKDKEIKAKEGTYKTKIILDLPKKSLIVAKGVGKNIFQALNDGLKKLKRQLTSLAESRRGRKP